MKKHKKEKTLTEQIQFIAENGVLNEETKTTIDKYNELVRRGIVIRRPYYVDTSGFRQVRDQMVTNSES